MFMFKNKGKNRFYGVFSHTDIFISSVTRFTKKVGKVVLGLRLLTDSVLITPLSTLVEVLSKLSIVGLYAKFLIRLLDTKNGTLKIQTDVELEKKYRKDMVHVMITASALYLLDNPELRLNNVALRWFFSIALAMILWLVKYILTELMIRFVVSIMLSDEMTIMLFMMTMTFRHYLRVVTSNFIEPVRLKVAMMNLKWNQIVGGLSLFINSLYKKRPD